MILDRLAAWWHSLTHFHRVRECCLASTESTGYLFFCHACGWKGAIRPRQHDNMRCFHVGPFEASVRSTPWSGGEMKLGVGWAWKATSPYDDTTAYFANAYLIWWRLRLEWHKEEAAV